MMDHLFQLLAPYLLRLFPSTRLASVLPPGLDSTPLDIIDQPVWQFLAAFALHASSEQQQILVSVLREKVLENISNATTGQSVDGNEQWTKLANVNLFLNALGIQFSGNQFVFKTCQSFFLFTHNAMCSLSLSATLSEFTNRDDTDTNIIRIFFPLGFGKSCSGIRYMGVSFSI
jgi:Topoisomerase II-associated protein PAT1